MRRTRRRRLKSPFSRSPSTRKRGEPLATHRLLRRDPNPHRGYEPSEWSSRQAVLELGSEGMKTGKISPQRGQGIEHTDHAPAPNRGTWAGQELHPLQGSRALSLVRSNEAVARRRTGRGAPNRAAFFVAISIFEIIPGKLAPGCPFS